MKKMYTLLLLIAMCYTSIYAKDDGNVFRLVVPENITSHTSLYSQSGGVFG